VKIVRIRKIKIGLKEELTEDLKGKVFHVTPSINMSLIEKSGAILPNDEGERESLFGNTINGYFRLRGCVSFFDYRKYGSEEWEKHSHKCTPTQLFNRVRQISILFLKEEEYINLECWSNWKKEEKWFQRVVPHIEIGYPGQVHLNSISEQLEVECISS